MNPASILSRVSWATFAQVWKVVLQFGGIAILTKLIPVADFGLLAMAALFTTFAALIQDLGTSSAIIQRKELSHELVSTVFWLNVLVGLAFCIILCGISPLAALLFQEPRLSSVLLALGLLFPISAIGTMPQAILQREGRLRRIALIELSAGTLGLAAGVTAAYHGFGVFSLVIQQGTTGILSTGQYWIACPRRPHFEWSREELKRTWAFTGHLVAFNTVNYFARNADNMLIGRFLGSTELAWYSMAYRVVTAPVQFFGSISSRVLLPVYSQRQDDPREIGTHFVQALALIAFLSGPIMALVWGLREPLVAVLLGPDWEASIPLFAWLAPVGYIQSLATNVGLVMIAVGRTKLLRNFGIINSVVFVGVFFASVPFGIEGVATGYFLSTLVLSLICLQYTLKLVHEDLWSLARAVWKQTIFSMIVAVGVWIPIEQDLLPDIPPLLLLFILAPIGGAVYLGLIAAFARQLIVSALGRGKS